MATYEKISDMDAASALDGTEVMEVVQSSVSVKATADQIVARAATTLAPKTNYTTGWVAETDFRNTDWSVIHNLNENLSDLIVKIFVSTDGTEANAFSVTDFSGYNATDTTATRYGARITQVSLDALNIHTGSHGFLDIHPTTGVAVGIAVNSYYYKIVVYYLGV